MRLTVPPEPGHRGRTGTRTKDEGRDDEGTDRPDEGTEESWSWS